MSHVVTVDLEIKDVAALRLACKRLNWELHEGQKTYKWYGRWMNDYNAEDAAYKSGIKPEDYGKCEHAITVTGCNYQIGVIKHPKKTGAFGVIFDFWDSSLKAAVGGTECKKLKQAYALEVAKRAAMRKGHGVTEQKLANGAIKLVIRQT